MYVRIHEFDIKMPVLTIYKLRPYCLGPTIIMGI